MKKTGFTLAEVLIALTIIGVIAAITVPALIQRTNKQEYVTALQKAYSTLSQVTNQIIAEEGSPKCQDESGNETGWACSPKDVYNLYKPHLNIVKDCGSSAGCYEQGQIRMLNGNLNGSKGYSWDTNNNYYKVNLNDGMQILFFTAGNDLRRTCSSDVKGGSSTNVCGTIGVDVNGVKGPNMYGREIWHS